MILQGEWNACLWWDSGLCGKENDFCYGTSWLSLGLRLFSRQVFPASCSFYIYEQQCTCQIPAVNLHSFAWLLAWTPGEHKLTSLFSLCTVVFSPVWLMRSIQTQLPWPLTPPTSGFPVYTMTTACMYGMSKTRRKWARSTLLCITRPACGMLR